MGLRFKKGRKALGEIVQKSSLVFGLVVGVVLGSATFTMAQQDATSAELCAKPNGTITLAVDGTCKSNEELVTIVGEQGPVGPVGPQGSQGPQGEPGEAGGIAADDLLIVEEEVQPTQDDENSVISVSAQCPEGMFAIGGGSGQANANFRLRASRLDDFVDNRTYSVFWFIPDNSTGPNFLARAFAYCLPDAAAS